MIQIHDAEYEDLPGIARVLVKSWQAAYRGIVEDAFLDALSEQAHEDRMRAQWDAGMRWPALVMTDEGIAVGVCSYGRTRDGETPCEWGEIGTCYLLPEYWGRGLGAMMLEHAERRLRDMSCPRIVIWVFEDNLRARRAYERAGFAPDGSRKMIEIGGKECAEVRYAKEVGKNGEIVRMLR